MEKISEMIQRLCPDGVFSVKLRDVAKLYRGKVISKDFIRDNQGDYPVYSSQTANDGILGYISSYMYDGSYLTWTTDGAYAGTIFQRTGKFNITNVCGLIDITSKETEQSYLFYWLSYVARNYVYEGMGNPKLMSNVMETIEIPLPPLPIQQEIVRILDSFTSMITNLETELASRQKQYEYYRNKLLTFDEGDESVEWKTLGDIGTMYKGKGIQKADFVDEGMPCIHYGQVHTYYGFSATETKSFVSEEMYSNSNKAKKGDLIIATTSEDVEACCKSTVWLGDTEPAISGDAHYFRHNQNPKYIGYLFMTEMFASQKRTAAVGAKVTRVHGDSILKFMFPIPTIQYQNDTVEKLDNFESLITNIKQELDARKKQYEYYREKLLTFE